MKYKTRRYSELPSTDERTNIRKSVEGGMDKWKEIYDRWCNELRDTGTPNNRVGAQATCWAWDEWCAWARVETPKKDEPAAEKKKLGRPSKKDKATGELQAKVDPSRFMSPTPDGKEPDKNEARAWVMRHLNTPDEMLEPEMCPNAFTWSLLLEARADSKWFFKDIYHGVKFNKNELEQDRKAIAPEHVLAQLATVDGAVQ